jgi:hypothetical protein
LYLHRWFIAKTWLNVFICDLEEDYNIEKMKRLKKSLISLLLSPFIIHSFSLNENYKFISKYLNINLLLNKLKEFD